MNYDLISLLVFFLILFIIFRIKRNKFEVQGGIFALYRTQLGIKLMDKLANKAPRFWKFIGYFGIVIGFIGMAFIFFVLIQGTIRLITVPSAPPAVAPVLPGVSIPGLPALSFWHWIIAIFFVAVVHEFSHGVLARANKIKVNSSGFAFLGPILAAFVEPDEKDLVKKKKQAQLAVFAAGPLSNIILGFVFVLLAGITFAPWTVSLTEYSGVQVMSVMDGGAAKEAGLQAKDVILAVNDVEVKNPSDFTKQIQKTTPGVPLTLKTERTTLTITPKAHPNGESFGYLGIQTQAIKTGIKESVKEKYGSFFPKVLLWIGLLIYWLYLINLGVGLFNLLPMGPLDGGRMFLTACTAIFKNEKVAKKVFIGVSIFALALIVINMAPFIWKLLKFIAQPFMLLF